MNPTSLIACLLAAWFTYTTFSRVPVSGRTAARGKRLEESVSRLMPKLSLADQQTASELVREIRQYTRLIQRMTRRSSLRERARLDQAYDSQMRILRLADQATVALSKQGPSHWDNARRFQRELAIAFGKDAEVLHDTSLSCGRVDLTSNAEGRRFDPIFDGDSPFLAFVAR